MPADNGMLRSSHSCAALKRVQPDTVGARRHFLPLRVERRPLQLRDLVEHGVYQQRQPAVAVAVRRPVVRRQHRFGRNRLDRSPLRHEVRVVGRTELGRQIVLLQRLGVFDRHRDRQLRSLIWLSHCSGLPSIATIASTSPLRSCSTASSRLLINQVRPDAERSNTLIAVTKVELSGKSTTTVLPSRSLMLAIVLGASTCISSLNIFAT